MSRLCSCICISKQETSSFFRPTSSRWSSVVGLAHAFESPTVPPIYSYKVCPYSSVAWRDKSAKRVYASTMANCATPWMGSHTSKTCGTIVRLASSKTTPDDGVSIASSSSSTASTADNEETRDRVISSSSLSDVEHDRTSISDSITSPSIAGRLSRRVRNTIGNVLTTVGFLVSSARAVWGRTPRELWGPIQEPLVAFFEFLKNSGTDQELQRILQDRSSLLSLVLLSRIHTHLSKEQESMTWEHATKETTLPSLEQVQRYMRFATAVYGQAMIRAAQIDARPSLSLTELVSNWISNITALGAISEHTGIPTQDLVVVQINYDYAPAKKRDNEDTHQDTYLRHLVAIDHHHKEVVLSLRGTFSLQEIVVDLVSFSRQDFVHANGQAHEGMATMAERVWVAAGPTILKTLQEYPDYEFVVTGHSLGAGTACLLTILLQHQQEQQRHRVKPESVEPPQLLLPPSTRLKCVAFAAPPVYSPIGEIPQATKLMTQVVHDRDVVPYLSVYSVRYLLQSLEYLNQATKAMSWRERVKLATSLQAPPSDLIEGIRSLEVTEPVEGAPRLQVPADQTVWLRESDPLDNSTTLPYVYQASVRPCMPWQIPVHPNMFVDHFPPRYEYALEHLKDWKDMN